MKQRTNNNVTYICFKIANNDIELYTHIIEYFVLIPNNNPINPISLPIRNTKNYEAGISFFVQCCHFVNICIISLIDDMIIRVSLT